LLYRLFCHCFTFNVLFSSVKTELAMLCFVEGLKVYRRNLWFCLAKANKKLNNTKEKLDLLYVFFKWAQVDEHFRRIAKFFKGFSTNCRFLLRAIVTTRKRMRNLHLGLRPQLPQTTENNKHMSKRNRFKKTFI
jgi:hypothetical protein